MKIVATKRTWEFSEQNHALVSRVFIVKPDETVEQLMLRIGLDGGRDWHYSDSDVVLKLVAQESPE